MTLITISRGSYSRGRIVAEKVAEKLGFKCISRDEIIENAANEFNVQETKLVRAVHEAPTFFDRFTFGKDRYVTYVQAALLESLHDGNAVYHGLAGHFFLQGITHVLKVRILADLKDRIEYVMDRDKCSSHEALQRLKKDDSARSKWSTHLYGIDTADPILYDLVIHVNNLTVNDAVDLICHVAELNHFKANPHSMQKMDDLLLSARVKLALIDMCPDSKVSATDGVVSVNTNTVSTQMDKLLYDIKEKTKDIDNIKDIKVDVKVNLD